MDLFTTKYEDLLLLCDFNTGMKDWSINIFCSNYNFENLTSMINKPTCYKNPDKPICIDLILTNCCGAFQNSCVIKTGLSDFHKMIVTVAAQKLKFSSNDFFSKCDEICRKLRIWSHLLKKSLMENFIFLQW